MSVICHGLSLPLSEHETIKDCVNVYCEWLTALFQTPKISVPRPICEDPNLYARKIINHFHNLFVPRQGEGEPNIHKNKLHRKFQNTIIEKNEEKIAFSEMSLRNELDAFGLQCIEQTKKTILSLSFHSDTLFFFCFSHTATYGADAHTEAATF